MLARAIAHGDGGYTMEALRADLDHLRAQLWLGLVGDKIEGALVTAIERRGDVGFLIHRYAAGENAAAWIAEGLPLIEDWARCEGATKQEVKGRRGWLRALPKPWRERWVVMQRDL